MSQPDFPDEWLSPLPGRLVPPRQRTGDPMWAIELPLEPFDTSVVLGSDGQREETSIRLDPVPLPAFDVGELAAGTFQFPLNPEPGYVDGSVYVSHVHNPIDVTEIAFGELRGRVIVARLRMRILFEHEGAGFRDRDALLHAHLEVGEAMPL